MISTKEISLAIAWDFALLLVWLLVVCLLCKYVTKVDQRVLLAGVDSPL